MKPSTPHHTFTQRKGFSLVELLVVIAIIAVLAGASYPAIMGAIKKAKIADGVHTASSLAFSIEQFEQKYEYLPYSSDLEPSGVQVYSTKRPGLLRVLMGKDTDLNPRNDAFFAGEEASNGVNGIIFAADGVTPKSLVDPWGNPYKVIIDYTGEETIDLGDVKGMKAYKEKNGKSTVIRKPAAVVSPGPDGQFDDIDDVKTW